MDGKVGLCKPFPQRPQINFCPEFDPAASHWLGALSMQMDGESKEERIETLIAWLRALEGGEMGEGVKVGPTQKLGAPFRGKKSSLLA
eukprot:960425-Pelagomonas_calceolata.AAC.2